MPCYPNELRVSIVTHVSFWAFLAKLDEDMAAAYEAKGCPHCGRDTLYRADYCPRAGLGLLDSLRGNVTRISFRYAGRGCGRHATPPYRRRFGISGGGSMSVRCF